MSYQYPHTLRTTNLTMTLSRCFGLCPIQITVYTMATIHAQVKPVLNNTEMMSKNIFSFIKSLGAFVNLVILKNKLLNSNKHSYSSKFNMSVNA